MSHAGRISSRGAAGHLPGTLLIFLLNDFIIILRVFLAYFLLLRGGVNRGAGVIIKGESGTLLKGNISLCLRVLLFFAPIYSLLLILFDEAELLGHARSAAIVFFEALKSRGEFGGTNDARVV